MDEDSVCCIICALAVLEIVFAVYAHYYTYAEVYINSRVAINIFHSKSTEAAFKGFYWIFAVILAFIHHIIVFPGMVMAKMMFKAVPCLFPLGLAVIASLEAVATLPLWLRPLVRTAQVSHVFNRSCTHSGWDLNVVLTAPTNGSLPKVLPSVGNATIWSNSQRNDTLTFQLIRHDSNHSFFDLVPIMFNNQSAVQPPFTNVTYSWLDHSYFASRPDSTNVTGTFQTQPSLAFPSLNIYTRDPKIPFQRPGYRGCWPSAATLMVHNTTAQTTPSRLLQSITLYSYLNVTTKGTFFPKTIINPPPSILLKVCASDNANNNTDELQISLGVLLINHFFFTLCNTGGVVQHGVIANWNKLVP